MIYLIVAAILFTVAVAIHLSICRRRKGKGLLVKVFCMIAGVNLLCAWAIFAVIATRWPSLPSSIWLMPLGATSTVIYILLIPTYVIFYVTTQLNSPSKTVLLLLNQHKGMSKEELLTQFTDDAFIMPRITDLLNNGCIHCKGGKYYILPSGEKIAKFLIVYQSILGRVKGG